MPKLIGHLNDVPVYEDPNAPAGVMYFTHEHWLGESCNPSYDCWVNNSRRQRVLLSLKRWYNSIMKKQYIFLAVVLLLVAGVTTLSIYKYNQEPKGITLTQAVHQRDTALADVKIQKQLNANDQQAVSNLTVDKQTLTTQKATLCAQIKAAKLVQPLCQ